LTLISGLVLAADTNAPVEKKNTIADSRTTCPGKLLPTPRFTVQAETNCVVDNLTGLMWTHHASMNGTNLLTWKEAIAFCKDLDYGGHKDWRLPQIREFYSIMNTNYTRPMLSNTEGNAKWKEGDPFKGVKEYDKGGVCYYWTTTTTVGEPAGAWLVTFFSGSISQESEATGKGNIWPVRDAK
jgi:hypothetical protein